MQIEVSESTIKRIAERVEEQGLPGVTGSDMDLRILDALAQSTNESTIAAIVEGIRETPGDPPAESARDIAERLGLLGAFESGVTNLSTNPMHMVGFGK
ncbi:MAG: hypothetical protein R3C17_03125 [Planctomycetaceae bacterium]